MGPAGNDPAFSPVSAGALIPLSWRPIVGKQGLEPHLPGPRPGALTLTRHPVEWRWQESNPLRQRLQGAPATFSCHPRRCLRPSPITKTGAGDDAHAVELSIIQARSPRRVVLRTGGRNRTLSTGLGDRRRNRPLHPHVPLRKTENRPAGVFPRRAALASWPWWLLPACRPSELPVATQGRRDRREGHARMPFVSLVSRCPEFHGTSFRCAA